MLSTERNANHCASVVTHRGAVLSGPGGEAAHASLLPQPVKRRTTLFSTGIVATLLLPFAVGAAQERDVVTRQILNLLEGPANKHLTTVQQRNVPNHIAYRYLQA